MLRAAIDAELHGVTRLLLADDVAEAVNGADGLAVGADDDVAAGAPRLAVDGDGRRPAAKPGRLSARARDDAGDHQPVPHPQVEDARDRRRDRLHLDAEERVLGLSILDQPPS